MIHEQYSSSIKRDFHNKSSIILYPERSIEGREENEVKTQKEKPNISATIYLQTNFNNFILSSIIFKIFVTFVVK